MHTLWILSGILTGPDQKHRDGCFRLLNSLLAGLAGLIVWLIVRLFALDSPDWLICFVGYPIVFHGLLGSTIWLLNVDDDSEE